MMSRTIEVKAERSYDVLFTQNWRLDLIEIASTRTRCAVILTESLREVFGRLDAGDCEVLYFYIPEGEEGKSPSTLLMLWNWLGAAGFTRSDLIVGVGGGAVTDIAGFAAATFLRGLDWVAVPTSVAGCVDAAIGGKTGANLDYGKNMIGAFFSPIKVLIDLSWFATLSDRDFAAGLAEVVKCGFIKDAQILHLLDGRSLASIRENRDLVDELIFRSVSVKADVVGSDFKEGYEREILNYGHTFGHAVEQHSQYSLRHGECVAIGMAYMAHLQLSLGLISERVHQLHFDLLQGLGLPTRYDKGDWPELKAIMSRDKKARGHTVRFVVISEIGVTDRLSDVAQSELVKAYEKVCS
jgi:3-dehydroquinate synthase